MRLEQSSKLSNQPSDQYKDKLLKQTLGELNLSVRLRKNLQGRFERLCLWKGMSQKEIQQLEHNAEEIKQDYERKLSQNGKSLQDLKTRNETLEQKLKDALLHQSKLIQENQDQQSEYEAQIFNYKKRLEEMTKNLKGLKSNKEDNLEELQNQVNLLKVEKIKLKIQTVVLLMKSQVYKKNWKM